MAMTMLFSEKIGIHTQPEKLQALIDDLRATDAEKHKDDIALLEDNLAFARALREEAVTTNQKTE